MSNFNSIKVRLEPLNIEKMKKEIKNFNSIKVRLEHEENLNLSGCLVFQFHKGAIRTGRWEKHASD